MFQPVIYNGEPAVYGSSPDAANFVVRLNITKKAANNKTALYNCTGALIAKAVVITAAHCAKDAIEINVISFDGESPGGQKPIKARQWFLHPNYKDSKELNVYLFPGQVFDIAVVGLNKPSLGKPIKMAPAKYDPSMFTYVKSFGAYRDKDYANTGMIGYIKLSYSDQLNKMYSLVKGYTASDQRSCPGDSGGPVTVQAYRSAELLSEPFLVGVNALYFPDQVRDPGKVVYAPEFQKPATDPRCSAEVAYMWLGPHYEWIRESIASMFKKDVPQLDIAKYVE